MSTSNLLELLLNLLRDPSAYREDPEGFLSDCGDVSPDDIREALILLQDRQDANVNRDYNTVDDRDTNIDNSTDIQVETEGGDFDADIDFDSTVASDEDEDDDNDEDEENEND